MDANVPYSTKDEVLSGRSLQTSANWAALRPAINRGGPGACRIHHRSHIADAFVEGLLGYPIREPLASLVEDNYTGKRAEPLEQVLLWGKSQYTST